MINIKYGSIFDEKCDLIVIPYHNYSGISSSRHILA